MKVKSLTRARLFATPWTVACTKLRRPWDFPGKSTGVGCHFLLQGIFLTQGLKPGLPHCRQTLYRLSHQGSPNLDFNWALKIPQRCHLQDTSKPACGQYKQQARQKRHKRVDEAEPLPRASCLSYVVISPTHCILVRGF